MCIRDRYYSERKRHFDFDEKEYLFGIKKPLADSTIENRKNKYCDKSGVKKIRIHDFRHSNVSLLVSLGADICVICSRLGHKDRNQTLNRYSPVSYTHLDVYKRQIIDRL